MENPTSSKQPANPLKEKKKKPISKMTRYEITRMRQKLWRENREKMERIRQYATDRAAEKAKAEDLLFQDFIANYIPARATMEEIRAIVERGPALVRTFKHSKSQRFKETRRKGPIKLPFSSFVVRATRKGYLKFDLESFTWLNLCRNNPLTSAD